MGHDHDGSFCWINLQKAKGKLCVNGLGSLGIFYILIYKQSTFREPCSNVRSGCSSWDELHFYINPERDSLMAYPTR